MKGETLSRIGWGLVWAICGVLGAGLFWLSLTLYQDHQLCNSIRAQVAQQQMQAARQLRQAQGGQSTPAPAEPAK
jgi:hypothetical protein